MQDVWLALIVAAGAIVTPLLTAALMAHLARKGKEQDWARQDAVAEQAAEAAALLLACQSASDEKTEAVARQAAEAAALLLASNKLVAEQAAASAQVISGKLAQVHDLVNSNLFAQMQESHGALA